MDYDSETIRKISAEHAKAPNTKQINFFLEALGDGLTKYKNGIVIEGAPPIDAPLTKMAARAAHSFKENYTLKRTDRATRKKVIDSIVGNDLNVSIPKKEYESKVILNYLRLMKYVKAEGEELVLGEELRELFEIPIEPEKNIEKILEKAPQISEKTVEVSPANWEVINKEAIQKEIIKEEKPIKEAEIKKDTKEERQYKKEEQKRIKEEIKEKARAERLYKKEANEKIKKERVEHVYSSLKHASDYINKPVLTVSFPDYKSAVKTAINSTISTFNSIANSASKSAKPIYNGIENLLGKSNAFFGKKVTIRNYHLVIVLPAFLAGMYVLGSQKPVMKAVDYGINSCIKSGSKAIKGIYKITSGEMNEIHNKTNR